MKNLYLPMLITAIVFLSSPNANSQFVPEPWEGTGNVEKNITYSDSLPEKQNILWYEDFADGLPQDWVNENLNGFCAFTHTYQGPQGPFSVGMPALASQSAENGFMILDSDLCSSQNSDGLTTNAYLQSPPIDISMAGNLMLTFQHNFRYCCSADQTLIMVEISTDGESWTSFDVRNGVGPNNTSVNPVYQAIDISHLTADFTQVWVRFRNTGASHYWWMIDDVRLVSFIDNDLKIVETTDAGGYAQIPAGQLSELVLGAAVQNAGGKSQTGVGFTTNVNEYLYSSVLQQSSIAPSQIEQFNPAEPFVVPGRGIYKVEYRVEQDQEDMTPENNTSSFVFEITDTTFSRTGTLHPDGPLPDYVAGEAFEAGNRYEITEVMELTSLSIVLDTTTQAGARIAGEVYVIDGPYSLIAQTNEYVVTAEDISSATEIRTLVLPLDLTLQPGEYMAVLSAPAQESVVGLAAVQQDNQPTDASFKKVGEQWQQISRTPFINMHFGENVADCDARYYFDVTNSLCGTASGSIEAIPLNGTAPYTFEWAGFPEINAALLSGLSAGDYEVAITDASGCHFTQIITVEDEEISVDFTTTPAICNVGGTILLVPQNGTEPFVYSWSHNDTLSGPLAEELSAGDYIITITDNNGCKTEVSVTVENQTELPVLVHTQDAWCGSASGTIELYPQAGSAPYSFQWDNYPDSTSSSLVQLSPGSYTFSVTDNNNCQFTGSADIGVNVYQLEAAVDKMDASCGLENGSISVEVVNGQSPYSYQWAGGEQSPVLENLAAGIYELEIVDIYGCTADRVIEIASNGVMPEVAWQSIDASGCGLETGSLSVAPTDSANTYTYTLLAGENTTSQETQEYTLDNLVAGRYMISVANNDGCELIVGINISDEDAPVVNADTQMISCHGRADGSISLSVENGVDPVYLWDEPDVTTADISNLPAGLYNVKVIDSNCVMHKSYEITQPEKLLAQASIDHIVCANEELGNILLDQSGGTAPFSFIWSNGASEKNLTDVKAGTYNVSITDFHECTFQETYTIVGNDSLAMEANIEYPTADEDDGSIVLLVSGGAGNYTYTWEHGAQSSVLSGLAKGTYSVTVTDSVGCQLTQTFLLDNTSVPAMEAGVLSVYPNPSSGALTINTPSWRTPNEQGFLEIYNILGERVKMQSIPAGTHSFTIRVDDLLNGVYILRLSNGDQRHQVRFVKK